MVRNYLIYRKALSNVPIEYEDCPQFCPKNEHKPYSATRTEKCGQCPKRKRYEQFERGVEANWEKWFSEKEKASLDYNACLGKLQRSLKFEADNSDLLLSEFEYVMVINQEESRLDKLQWQMKSV